MRIRHLARQRAVQLLYAWEFSGEEANFAEVERLFLAADKLHRRGWGPFARTLAHQAHERRAELDMTIRPTLKNWTLERLPAVDLICLRLALCELAYFPDIPMRVTINEYIEMARIFGNDESPVYINAVLDTLSKAFPQKDFQVGEDPEAAIRGAEAFGETNAAEAAADAEESPEAEELPDDAEPPRIVADAPLPAVEEMALIAQQSGTPPMPKEYSQAAEHGAQESEPNPRP